MFRKKVDNSGEFLYTDYQHDKYDDEAEYDLGLLFEKSNEEMIAQQAKRDQIISLYLAMFSFIVPFALSIELPNQYKGLIFLAVAIIGFLFSLVIIRYRLYKESYWLCCQTLTSLMSFKQKEINKELVQGIYYQCMKKKCRKYVDGRKTPLRFRWWAFYKSTLYSGETLLYIIQAFITSLTFGLSLMLLCSGFGIWQILIAVFGALLLLFYLINAFLSEVMHVYDVLIYGTNASFNKTYSRAWYLHLFV